MRKADFSRQRNLRDTAPAGCEGGESCGPFPALCPSDGTGREEERRRVGVGTYSLRHSTFCKSDHVLHVPGKELLSAERLCET